MAFLEISARLEDGNCHIRRGFLEVFFWGGGTPPKQASRKPCTYWYEGIFGNYANNATFHVLLKQQTHIWRMLYYQPCHNTDIVHLNKRPNPPESSLGLLRSISPIPQILQLSQGRIQDLWKGGGGAAATASAAGAKVFGGSRLKTLFGISKGGARAPPLNPLVFPLLKFSFGFKLFFPVFLSFSLFSFLPKSTFFLVKFFFLFFPSSLNYTPSPPSSNLPSPSGEVRLAARGRANERGSCPADGVLRRAGGGELRAAVAGVSAGGERRGRPHRRESCLDFYHF